MAQARTASPVEKSKPAEFTKNPAPDRHDRIATAAYHRWQARGGGHGSDQQDWFDAESEVDGARKS